MVYYRRHRGAGRGRLSANHRAAEPLQQDRWRDGAARESGGKAARTRGRDRADVRGGRRAGRKERRTARGAGAQEIRRREFGRVSGKVWRVRPAELVEAESGRVSSRGKFSAAGHGQAGFAEGEGTGGEVFIREFRELTRIK